MIKSLQGLSNGSNYCYYISALQSLASNPSVQNWIKENKLEYAAREKAVLQNLEDLQKIQPNHQFIHELRFLLPQKTVSDLHRKANHLNAEKKEKQENWLFWIIGIISGLLNSLLYLGRFLNWKAEEESSKEQLNVPVKTDDRLGPIDKKELENPISTELVVPLKSRQELEDALGLDLPDIEKILVVKVLSSLISLNNERLTQEDRNLLIEQLNKDWGLLKEKIRFDDGGRVRQKVSSEKYLEIINFLKIEAGPSESLVTTFEPYKSYQGRAFNPYTRTTYQDQKVDMIQLELSYNPDHGFFNTPSMNADSVEETIIEKDYFDEISHQHIEKIQTKKSEQKRIDYSKAKELFFEITPKLTEKATEQALKGQSIKTDYNINIPIVVDHEDKSFILQSIILKSGAAGSGHYVTLKPQIIAGEIAWVCLNDNSIYLDTGSLKDFFPTNMMYVESSLLKEEDRQIYLAGKDTVKEFRGDLKGIIGRPQYPAPTPKARRGG
jgi:Ubiquitin carboxyl-terminal hydrolase